MLVLLDKIYKLRFLSQMLSDRLVSESNKAFDRLDKEEFIKVINYCVNLILNSENQLKIHEFIEISEQQGDRLTQTTLQLIHSLIAFHVNANLLEQKIKLLKLEKQRSAYLKDKINQNLYELRKILFDTELKDVHSIQEFNWRQSIEKHRFEVVVASKSSKNLFQPKLLLNLKVQQPSINEEKTIKNHFLESDFANLKNLQHQLNSALKMHRNPKHKAARNSSV